MQTNPLVVVLEDNLDRRSAMQAEVGDLADLQFFGGVPEFASFVQAHSNEVAAISLDHDLILPQAEERMLTPEERILSDQLGDGVLACQKLLDIFEGMNFPNIIVHTSNNGRRYKMLSTLDVVVPDDLTNGQTVLSTDGRRNVTVVFPYNDLSWVKDVWGPAMRKLFEPANDD
jgi:hypothetical protein